MQKRLGRGLGSLLREPGPQDQATEVEIASIRPNPQQPRKTFRPEALDELKASIQNHGVLQPIVVRPIQDGFELIAGERRFRAAQLAGLKRIPAVVRQVRDDELLELALVENVQRQDLDPIEKAEGYRDLMERLDLTQEQVAAKVGLQRPTVANHLRLLELPEPVREALAQGLVSMGHARALLGLQGDRERVELLEAIVREQLSVREVEQRVRGAQGGAKPKPASPASPKPETPAPEKALPWVQEIEHRLRDALGTKVAFHSNEECQGRIAIEFFDRPTLERLLSLLAPKREV